jgi:hypothetical protein
MSRPKTTLPYNPVADRMRAMITGATADGADQVQPTQATQQAKATKPTYLRASFQVPQELLAEIRDAVIALSGPPTRLTMAQFAEDAFRHELDRLQAGHNGGKPFQPSDGAVRVGRPVGT